MHYVTRDGVIDNLVLCH